MERLTIPDVRVDEHTTRRSVIDVLAVQEHAMEIYHQLKIYEDIAELCGGFARLRELAEADKDGRVVVLPCKGYSSIDIARDGVSYRPDHWNIYLTAYAHGQNTPSGLKVGLFDIGEVERAMQEMEGKKDGKT